MSGHNAGTVAIKLNLRGQEELKRRLGELGPEGERVFRDLSRAAKPTQQDFKLVDRATRELQDGMDDLAQRAGPVGAFLTSVGPWGLAAAAGIGALAMAVREVFILMERSRETAFWAEELENVERASGLAAERILSIGSAAQMAGADFNAVLSGMEEFSKRIGEYRATGQGEARDAFDSLGLRDLVDSGADATAILDAVLERMREIDDPSRRLALADKLGLREAAPLLQQSADEMGRLLAVADDVNAAFSERTLARLAEAATALREAEMRRDRARDMQSVGLLETELRLAEARAELDERIAGALSYLVDERERETEALEMQRDLMRSIAHWAAGIPGFAQAARQEYGRLNEALERRVRLEEISAANHAAMMNDIGVSTRVVLPGAEGDGSRELDTQRDAELRNLVEQSLRSIMTPLEQVTELENELRLAQRNRIDITDEQIEAILHHRRAALDLLEPLKQLTDEERKAAGAAAAANDPLEAQKELLESLTGPADAARERLGRLYALWADSPEHADIITAEIERVKDALYGQEDSNVIRMEDRLPGLAKMAREYSDTMDMLDRGGVNTLDTIHEGLMNMITGADSVGDAFERMGQRVVETFIEIQLQRSIIGPLAGALDTFISGLFDGGASAAAGSGSSGLPGFDRGADILVGGNRGIDNNLLSINHKPTAWVSADETVRILPNMTGQTGGGGQAPARVELADLNITLKDERGGGQGGRARASERRSANGTRELTIWLEEQVGGLMGSGKFDDEMRSRYGITPAAGAR